MEYRFGFAEIPLRLRRSAQLLWLSLLLGAVTQLGERLWLGSALPPAELARLLAFVVLAYGLSAWVVWELARGRPWARLALSGWLLLSLFAWLSQLAEAMPWWQHGADALVLLLDALALYLAWTGSAAQWFRSQRHATDAAPSDHD